ncbi:MAG: c-type cytochrome, partial [Gloeobacteraceae cyanobacterium ES-bin-144]|nr:c-type cytochrome [Verrucomicrobiales bacterium]
MTAYKLRMMARLSSLLILGLSGSLPGQDSTPTGQALYSEHCASCHGKNGEGVEDECEEPLHGERPLPALARFIDRKMPEDNPETLDAGQSQVVAEYIMGAFYSPEARAKNQPPAKPA